MNNLLLDIQKTCEPGTGPDDEEIESWVSLTLTGHVDPQTTVELSVRIVEPGEIIHLNETYRNKSGTTNVLSFPFEPPPGFPCDEKLSLLGDIVICAEVVEREASEQNKSAAAHWAHMLVHGTLHLLGYDHETESDAQEMENKERQILHSLGIADPYTVAPCNQKHFDSQHARCFAEPAANKS